MKTYTPEEYQKKFGTEAYVNLHKISTQPIQQPNVFQRIGNTIKQAGSDVADIYQQGINREISPIKAGTGIVAKAFNAVPQVATDILPEPARKVVGAVEKGAGNVINWAANNAGKNPFTFSNPNGKNSDNTPLVDTPQYQKFSEKPEVKIPFTNKTLNVEETAGTLSDTGQISGDILATDQFAKTAQKGVDITKKVGQRSGQVMGEVKSNVQDLSQNLTQKAKEFTNKVKVNNNPDTFIKDLVMPEMKGTEAVKALKTGKVTEAQGMGQRDFSGAVNNLDDLENAVKQVPGVSPTKTRLENLNAIHDEVGNLANKLEQQVAKEKSFFSPNKFKSIMNEAKSRLSEDPTLVGDAATSANKVITKFERLVEQEGYTSAGLLKARKLLDAWIRSQKGGKIFNPATESGITGAVREIRQTGNQFLADISPNSEVKGLLNQQSNLYRAIDNIAPKAVKEGSSVLEQIIKAHPVVSKVIKTAGRAAGFGLGVKMGEDFIP